jgi:hypothetical protein
MHQNGSAKRQSVCVLRPRPEDLSRFGERGTLRSGGIHVWLLVTPVPRQMAMRAGHLSSRCLAPTEASASHGASTTGTPISWRRVFTSSDCSLVARTVRFCCLRGRGRIYGESGGEE